MNTSTRLARTIVRQLLEAGITDVVISPGSRNAPLSIAFDAAAQRGLIKLHIRIDERTAAFFALGLSKASNKPVPIVCTSGTAVANYHPAVLEASHSNIGLLVLTADRPAVLRRTGANQTTEQARIFGKAVRYFADISGPVYPMELPLNSLQSGPVHLNIQFEEPLIEPQTELDSESNSWLETIQAKPIQTFDRKKSGTLRTKSARGVLVIGHDRGGLSSFETLEFAKKLQWPIISEDPLLSEEIISHASIFLASEKLSKGLTPEVVITIGRTTLSRSINKFTSTAVKKIVIDPRILTVDSDREADQRFTSIPELEATPADQDWITRWRKISDRAAKVVADTDGWNEPCIARDIASNLPNGSTLFISSSRPIRDIEAFGTARTGIETFANRGLAGIDGNISTALGIASSRNKTFAIIGDLSFLHDLTGLIQREEIDLSIIVLNNDGGGIFSTLPQAGVDGFERIFGTPHGLDISAIVASFGVKALKISNQNELFEFINQPVKGLSIAIIDLPSRESNAALIKSLLAEIDGL